MNRATRIVTCMTVVWIVPATAVHAQCADGTPPPCEVRAQLVIARAAPPPSEAERGRSFLVLPFRNITGAPEYEWLVEGSPVLLADALGQWQEVSVVPPERLAPALRRHGLTPGEVMDEDRVKLVAEETGGWTAVTGEVLATGGELRVSARAYDVATNRVVVQATGRAAADDPRAAYEELAGQLLSTAGLEVERPDLSAATTSSLDAYKAYLEGMRHLSRGEARQAREWFKAAVRADSNFAQAYMKLAEASFTTVDAFQNPQSDAYRFAEKAASLAYRLPPRDRALVEAQAAMVRGRLGEARAKLESLVAADSNDVEALDVLGDLEVMDPILVTRNGVERPRGSLNEAARLAKRGLALDPTRHQQNYSKLVSAYALAGGLNQGRVIGVRGEQPSLMALFVAMITRPARTFTAVLRDSIELVPADSIDTLDPDSLEIWRDRAREIAKSWVGQWVAATPDAGYAYLQAAMVYAEDEEHDAALTFLQRAESLGVEVEIFQNFAGRRLAMLTAAGRYAEASKLADSLGAAGYFTPSRILSNPLAQTDAAWAYNLHMLTGRFDRAEQLVDQFRALVLQQNPALDSAQALRGTLCYFGCRTDLSLPANFPDVREKVRFTVLDSLLDRLEDFPTEGALAAQFGAVVGNPLRNAADEAKTRFADRFTKTAGRLIKVGRSELAVGLGIAAGALDSSMERSLALYRMFRDVIAEEPDNLPAHYQVGKFGVLTGTDMEVAERSLLFYLENERPPDAPSHASAHWRLGMLYERMDRRDDARQQYLKALELEPDHAQAKAALEKLMGGRN
ncbi:MAG: tetratricopeptide repeat protein [Gemmatimonadales bacterium]